MICPVCGNKASADSQFCSQCGAPLSVDSVQDDAYVPPRLNKVLPYVIEGQETGILPTIDQVEAHPKAEGDSKVKGVRKAPKHA